MYIDTDIDVNLDHESESTCSIGTHEYPGLKLKSSYLLIFDIYSFFEETTRNVLNQCQFLNSWDPQERDLNLIT